MLKVSSQMQAKPIDPLLRLAGVEGLVGLKKSAIYALMQQRLFPAPVRLTGRAVAWRTSDVAAWIESRAAQTDLV